MVVKDVSVIIDTYNHARFLKDAIDSVIGQTYKSDLLQIIIVDDGSTDETAEIVSSYGPLVEYHRKANGGQASAFNFAIPLCRGRYVAFLDGDDWWEPTKLEKTVKVLEESPDVVAVGTGLKIVMANRWSFLLPRGGDKFDLTSLSGAKEYQRSACFFGTSRLLARRQALQRIGPVPIELKFEADEYFFCLLPALGPVQIVREPLTSYRIHDSNLFQFSGADESKMLAKAEVLEVLLKVLPNKLRSFGVAENIIASVLLPTGVEARKLRLRVSGGSVGSAFKIELMDMSFAAGFTLRRLIVCLPRLVLALILPPKMFYRIKSWYSSAVRFKPFA